MILFTICIKPQTLYLGSGTSYKLILTKQRIVSLKTDFITEFFLHVSALLPTLRK